MTMLYSVNIRILGNRANVPLIKQETLFTQAAAWGRRVAAKKSGGSGFFDPPCPDHQGAVGSFFPN